MSEATAEPISELSTLTSPETHRPSTPFKRIMAANRAEIAVRIMRAATELNLATVAIYGYEDRYSQHRWGADQSFLLEKTPDMSPVQAYLDIKQVIKIAQEHDVDAIHPGYGFLSESSEFAQVKLLTRMLQMHWSSLLLPASRSPSCTNNIHKTTPLSYPLPTALALIALPRVHRTGVCRRQHRLHRPNCRESQHICR